MDKNYKKIKPEEIHGNPFKMLGEDWMLITAGKKDKFNTMTAAWGGFGVLWHKTVAYIFIRPQRYTYHFTEENDYFTLSFFPEEFRYMLEICGNKSGKDVDKVKVTGLQPIETELKNIAFKQANLIIECKKMYYDDLNPQNFLDSEIHKSYQLNDYHRVYVGEIINVWKK